MIPQTDKEWAECYEAVLFEIKKVLDRIPPYYAYGDNEAAVHMANMLQEIDMLVSINLERIE